MVSSDGSRAGLFQAAFLHGRLPTGEIDRHHLIELGTRGADPADQDIPLTFRSREEQARRRSPESGPAGTCLWSPGHALR